MRIIIESTKITWKNLIKLQKFDRSHYLNNFNSFQLRVGEGNYIMYFDKLRFVNLHHLVDTNYRITEDFDEFLSHVEQMQLLETLGDSRWELKQSQKST